MSSTEAILEAALIERLSADAGVRAVAGEPLRLAGAGEGRPAYPFIELRRHETRPADSQDAPASEHVLELGVVSRNDAGAAARAGAEAVRLALEDRLAPVSGRCVLTTVLSVAVAPGADGLWRAIIRIRAVFEPN